MVDGFQQMHNKSLGKDCTFRILIAVPLALAACMALQIIIDLKLGFSFSYIGFKNISKYFTTPLYVASSVIPIAGLYAAIFRSAQTQQQINHSLQQIQISQEQISNSQKQIYFAQKMMEMTKNQNEFNNYFKHLEEYKAFMVKESEDYEFQIIIPTITLHNFLFKKDLTINPIAEDIYESIANVVFTSQENKPIEKQLESIFDETLKAAKTEELHFYFRPYDKIEDLYKNISESFKFYSNVHRVEQILGSNQRLPNYINQNLDLYHMAGKATISSCKYNSPELIYCAVYLYFYSSTNHKDQDDGLAFSPYNTLCSNMVSLDQSVLKAAKSLAWKTHLQHNVALTRNAMDFISSYIVQDS